MKKLLTLYLLLTSLSLPVLSQLEDYDYWILSLADSMNYSLLEDEGNFVNDLFNMDRFFEKILIENDDENIQEYNEYFTGEFFGELEFGNILSKSIQQTGGYYDYLNHYLDVDGKIHILFRLFGDDMGVNYHDFQFEYIDSAYQITDLYIYFSGELLSETYTQMYRQLLRDFLNKKSNTFHRAKALSSWELVNKARKLNQEEKFKEAIDVFNTIPEKYQSQRYFQFWKIQLYLDLEDPTGYEEALQEFEKAYPDDPSIFLLAIDKYTILGDFDEAIRYINKLDVKVGLDPFLNFMRANMYYLKEDFEMAEKLMLLVYEDFQFLTLNILMFSVYHDSNQPEKAINSLSQIEKEYEVTRLEIFDWIKEDFKEFCESQIFLDWKNEKKE